MLGALPEHGVVISVLTHAGENPASALLPLAAEISRLVIDD